VFCWLCLLLWGGELPVGGKVSRPAFLACHFLWEWRVLSGRLKIVRMGSRAWRLELPRRKAREKGFTRFWFFCITDGVEGMRVNGDRSRFVRLIQDAGGWCLLLHGQVPVSLVLRGFFSIQYDIVTNFRLLVILIEMVRNRAEDHAWSYAPTVGENFESMGGTSSKIMSLFITSISHHSIGKRIGSQCWFLKALPGTACSSSRTALACSPLL